MKLQKALEKAKEERSAAKGIGTIEPAGRDMDWAPPVYTESRPVEIDKGKLEKNRCVCISADAPEADLYKVLRAQIQQRTRAQGWRTVMITSALPGEGKTITAINLAITFARDMQQTVLLVDCDFRRQNLHRKMGFASEAGLIDHIAENRPLKEIINWPGIEKLTVISGGKTVRDSTELLGSPKMKAVVAEMKSRYQDRYVLFEVPPLLGGADAVTFAPLVDAIIMVVEAERTAIDDVKKALSLLPQEKFLGFVLNRQKAPMRAYKAYTQHYATQGA